MYIRARGIVGDCLPMGKISAKKTRFSIAAKRVNAGRFNALRSCEIKRWQNAFFLPAFRIIFFSSRGTR